VTPPTRRRTGRGLDEPRIYGQIVDQFTINNVGQGFDLASNEGSMELADFAGPEMDDNTETGREILHQAGQLPPIGPPSVEVEDLSARLED
jgi:hypothetical protein